MAASSEAHGLISQADLNTSHHLESWVIKFQFKFPGTTLLSGPDSCWGNAEPLRNEAPRKSWCVSVDRLHMMLTTAENVRE